MAAAPILRVCEHQIRLRVGGPASFTRRSRGVSWESFSPGQGLLCQAQPDQNPATEPVRLDGRASKSGGASVRSQICSWQCHPAPNHQKQAQNNAPPLSSIHPKERHRISRWFKY